MTIKQTVKQLKSGKITATQLVTEALERAEAAKDYHIFLHLTKDRALQCAKEIDDRLKKGEDVGILAGIPFVNKDNILAFDGPTTAASKILSNFNAPLQATVIEKLETAGAINIGKTNLDAFAHGGSTEGSAFGPSKNAVDKDRVPGGSSGGSAVAVALGITPFALGTDTGGSIRQPASFNGVFGFKPTYGLVSRFGAVAMSSGTDTIGCFATNAEDIDLVMSVISGRDGCDATTYDSKYQLDTKFPAKSKIGVIKQFMADGVNPEVLNSVNYAIDKLRNLGHEVVEVDIEEVKYALSIYYIVVSAEIASNLARYDGIRFGQRSKTAKTLDELYGLSRNDGFEVENKRRIMIGNYVLSSGYFDAYYIKVQQARTLMIDRLKAVFRQYDFLIGPVTPEPAFKFNEKIDDPLKMYLFDVLTTPANLAGLPAISVPSRPTKAGLPVGVQLIGKFDQDSALINLAGQLAKALEEDLSRQTGLSEKESK